MDCFRTYFTHVQTRDNVRVQSATQELHRYTSTYFAHVQTCDNVRVQSAIYAMDCFGTYFTHVQTCDNVRVQSATQWTASVHTLHMSKPVITFVFKVLRKNCIGIPTLHMSKPVITFVFKVLRNGLLRYILYTCPNL